MVLSCLILSDSILGGGLLNKVLYRAKDTVGLNHDKLTFMTGEIILELKYREDDGKKKL